MNKDYTIIENINDKQILLNALSVFEDEDFNGNNGLEFCKDETIDAGFNSDKDYILSVIKHYEEPQKIIDAYLDYWLGGYFYEYELIRVDDKKAVLYIIWDYSD